MTKTLPFLEEEIKKLSYTSFRWNIAGSAIRYGAGFLINIVLARLLGPEPYGLVALSTVVISIGNLVVDSGLNAGLVQKEELEEESIKFVFTIQIVLGIGIYTLIILCSQFISDLFHQPEVGSVLRILSLTIIFQAASQTSLGLLKRNLAFNRIQQAQVISYLIGYLLIGVPLAFANQGVWSLVFAQLSQSFINMVLVYSFIRHPIGIQLHDKYGISKFGMKILGANIANWIISNLDSALIGRHFGSTTLGFYNRAMSLASTPVGIVVTASQGVLFSASSRLQGSRDNVRRAFIKTFRLFSEILIPFLICVSITAGPIIDFVYGSKWSQTVPFVKVLAIALAFFALMAIEGPVLAGIGKPEIELRIQWIVAVVDIIVLFVAAQFSITYVIWAVLGIYIFRFILMTNFTFKAIQIPFTEFMGILSGSTFLTIGSGMTVYFVGRILPGYSSSITLIFQIILGMFVWGVLIIIKSKYFSPFETFKMAKKIVESIRFHNKNSE